MKKSQLIMCFVFAATLIANGQTLAQNTPITTFWKQVQYKIDTRSMYGGVSGWLYDIAQRFSYVRHSTTIVILDNLINDKTVQDEVFRQAYLKYQTNKEGMRMLLAGLCGSFTVANPVSEYITKKYSKDPAMIKAIAKQKQSELESKRFIEETERKALEEEHKSQLDTTENELKQSPQD